MKNNNYYNMIMGAVIGDAVGVPYEFKERGTFEYVGMTEFGTHTQPRGVWSDDSSMLLVTARDIASMKNDRLLIQSLKVSFDVWLSVAQPSARGYNFDVGNTTYIALSKGEGQTSERSNGNGSLMRVAPLISMIKGKSLKEQYALVESVSAITHAHPTSVNCCFYFIRLLHYIDKGCDIETSMEGADDDCAIMKLKLRIKPKQARKDIKSTGYVVDTLQAVVWVLENSVDYKDAIDAAVKLGGDTDTIACIAGAAAGLYYNEIHEPWAEDLKKKHMVSEIAESFAKR